MTEPCSCPIAGYCPRHDIVKDERLHALCRDREDYRRVFDDAAKRAAAQKCGNWREEGPNRWVCPVCNRAANAPSPEHLPKERSCHRPKKVCAPPPPGPGAELASILKSIGIVAKEGCNCPFKAKTMDAWGVAGCRARAGEIVEMLRKAYSETDRWQRAKAVAMTAATGLALKINWVDPFPSVVELAISQAEQKYPQEAWQRWTEAREAV